MNNLPEIDYKKPNKNPTIDSDNSVYELPFYKDGEYFSSLENYINFIKAVERMVRTSNQYSRYIKYLKENIGLTYCQVLSNVKDEYAEIEMHHGPILTLFDYASIITDYLISDSKKINSFMVTDILLKEHYDNTIQIVMLAKTVHQQVHEHNVFLNIKHGFGDISAFLKKYRKGLYQDTIDKINHYIDLSLQYDSFDKHVLDLKDKVYQWSNK
jgi:hypothetical protein